MHSRRLIRLGALAVTALGVGAATVAADPFGTLANPQRLEIISRATAINDFVDVGPAGPSPGDLYAFSDAVFLASAPSQRIGRADGRCVMIDPTTARFGCSITTSLPDGDIVTDGTGSLAPGAVSTGAVTGGTQQFRNARGDATLEMGPPEGPHHVTFRLIVLP